jgi:hypothetical protein
MGEPDKLKPEFFFKIILNVSGPLGLAATLLGWVKPAVGVIWIVLSCAYIVWELEAHIRTFVRRQVVLSLVIFACTGALAGVGLWAVFWNSKPSPPAPTLDNVSALTGETHFVIWIFLANKYH